MDWFTLAGVVVVIASYIFASRRTTASFVRESESELAPIELSLADAESTVVALISSGDMVVEDVVKTASGFDNLGPITRAFFSRYL